MPILDFSTYKNKILYPQNESQHVFLATGTLNSGFISSWNFAQDAALIPSTAVTCSAQTVGAAIVSYTSSNDQYIAQSLLSSTEKAMTVLCDRLSHMGGLNATVTGSITTNLPTAALPRHTNGEGVMMSADIYTLIGATGTLLSASYTNQDGVSGRQSKPIVFGLVPRRGGMSTIIPLQEGDRGVRSVESVHLVATTGTAGNYGITLFKPLLTMLTLELGEASILRDAVLGNAGQLVKIDANACYYYTSYQIIGAAQSWNISHKIIEDN